jgi:hypothetical protein
MKIDVSFIHPDKQEGDIIGEYQLPEFPKYSESITIEEIKKQREHQDLFVLPNGEVLQIKGGYCDTNFTINIRQEQKLLAQLISSSNGNLVFPTLAGGTVFFEMYFQEHQHA